MRRSTLFIVFVLALALMLAACGGGGEESSGGGSEVEAPVGDATAGETLYNQVTVGSANAPGCVTCHSLEEGVVLVGPSHAGVGTRAATYVSGQSAEQYLRTSIKEPDAHIVEGFPEGVMSASDYGGTLTDQEVDNLVAYLLTLK